MGPSQNFSWDGGGGTMNSETGWAIDGDHVYDGNGLGRKRFSYHLWGGGLRNRVYQMSPRRDSQMGALK